jgi:hypothetical protein
MRTFLFGFFDALKLFFGSDFVDIANGIFNYIYIRSIFGLVCAIPG